MAPEELKAAAIQAGIPEMFAGVLADTDAGVAKGALYHHGGELARLIGRSTTPFRDTITSFVQTPPSPGAQASHTP
jgi:NAD(P)H dehydrogenase (quinone)